MCVAYNHTTSICMDSTSGVLRSYWGSGSATFKPPHQGREGDQGPRGQGQGGAERVNWRVEPVWRFSSNVVMLNRTLVFVVSSVSF